MWPQSRVYGKRMTSLYREEPVNPRFCENPYILRWWTSSHDELISKQIEKDQWVWDWQISDAILAITSPEIIERWVDEDPKACWELAPEEDIDPEERQYIWYNMLMYFAKSRAERLGLTNAMREPQTKVCPICGQKFREDSIWVPIVEGFEGVDNLVYCSPCVEIAVHGEGNDEMSREEILTYFRDLAIALRRIPTQQHSRGGSFRALAELGTEERLAIIPVQLRKPTLERVRAVFGSWQDALVEAGMEPVSEAVASVLKATTFSANDGHICYSFAEKLIDDQLNERDIVHEKRATYPETGLQALFKVGGAFIEYFGTRRNSEDKAEMKLKKQLCKRHGIKLITVYRKDLASTERLTSKLSPISASS